MSVAHGKHRYVNVTAATTTTVDGLRPNAQYEFAVQAHKGRRESAWSMTATNTTHTAGENIDNLSSTYHCTLSSVAIHPTHILFLTPMQQRLIGDKLKSSTPIKQFLEH